MTQEEKEKQLLELEIRKIKSLEKIANSLDALTIWFEEIDKDEWSQRIQYYLAEFHTKIVKGETPENSEEEKQSTKKK
jgi:hypothetical protein